MSEIAGLLVTAAVVEAVWEWLKPVWPRGLISLEEEKGLPVDRLGVLLLSLGICFAARLDLPAAAGVTAGGSFWSILLSGILAGRGANFWHDLLGVFDGIRRDKKPVHHEPGL